jgi:hypothetical protein
MKMRWAVRAGVLGLALFLVGCAGTFGLPETAPGPGVPRIANLQFDPNVVSVGQTTQMSFYFEVGSADIEEGFLIERGISQFQFFQSLQTISLDLKKYAGQVAATVEVPLRWDREGVLQLELYVVSKKGNVSNHLRAYLTVR